MAGSLGWPFRLSPSRPSRISSFLGKRGQKLVGVDVLIADLHRNVNVRTGASTRIPGYPHNLASPDSLTLRYEERILGRKVTVLNDFAGVEPDCNLSTIDRVLSDADYPSGPITGSGVPSLTAKSVPR